MDHLATTTQDGRRVYLYPADVRGRFRRLRNGLNLGLILIFLGLPWFRIGGRPTILLDLPHRKFALFGVQFWAHDAPMIFLVLASLALSIFFVTAVFGRLWCGYACPQTVFVDGVFRRIERWIEGDALERRRLDQAPWSSNKLLKKLLKWAVFVAVSLVIGHSFLAYFVGTERLAEMMAHSPLVNPSSFLVMAAVSALVLFVFGWFREQFCLIVCPYGRFQSVLMDDRSLVVAYDSTRGEPRRGSMLNSGKTGDCVNCYRCVAVCPTGVDIRRGTQMECIACSACVDACDRVMERLAKAPGLIRYGTLGGAFRWSSVLRPRALLYGGLCLASMIALGLKVRAHTSLSAEFIRATELPYQLVIAEDGTPSVINHFKLDLRNQDFDDFSVNVRLSSEARNRGVTLVMIQPEVHLKAGQSVRTDLFLRFPRELVKNGRASTALELFGKDALSMEVPLVGPLF
jgi:cytochrome c oxidase accessory protein FixG